MEKFFIKKTEKEPLNIQKVFDVFYKISQIKGNSAETEKIGLLSSLFFDAKDSEVKYLVRFV